MARRLLVVERVIRKIAGELVLAPVVDASEARADPFRVEVRRLDGSVFPARARISTWPESEGAKTALVRLLGVRDHIPPQTEIWTIE